MTHAPDDITHSSVVTEENVCISFTVELLHDQEVKVADVLNTSLMAPK